MRFVLLHYFTCQGGGVDDEKEGMKPWESIVLLFFVCHHFADFLSCICSQLCHQGASRLVAAYAHYTTFDAHPWHQKMRVVASKSIGIVIGTPIERVDRPKGAFLLHSVKKYSLQPHLAT